MVIYRFPPDNNEEGSSGSKQESAGKVPDFIYVDNQGQQEAQKEPINQQGSYSNTSMHLSYPFFLRFLTLFMACLLTLFLGVLLVLLTVVIAIAAVLLFQSPAINETISRVWKLIGHFSAYALALFVATLNPGFGFGIFALYTLQSGGSAQEMPFSKIFKGRY